MEGGSVLYSEVSAYLLPVVSHNPTALEGGGDGSVLGPVPDSLRAHAQSLSKLLD
ncbi:MAG: hypothetical protein LZF62_480323 [Nitrospira sp.]|nr:MAG: hypothetical protein LZF62_480323 [Nitrospira sp.]